MKNYFYTLLQKYLSLYILHQNTLVEIDPIDSNLVKRFLNSKYTYSDQFLHGETGQKILNSCRIDFDKIGVDNFDYIILSAPIHSSRDIQKLLGVLPAQMSRIIRSLENRDIALISCSINPLDKRKIDVVLTDAGNTAFENHQTTRVCFVQELLQKLNDEEIDDLKKLVDRLTDLIIENSKTHESLSSV